MYFTNYLHRMCIKKLLKDLIFYSKHVRLLENLQYMLCVLALKHEEGNWGNHANANFCENIESGLLVIARNFDTFPTEFFPGLPIINHGKKMGNTKMEIQVMGLNDMNV